MCTMAVCTIIEICMFIMVTISMIRAYFSFDAGAFAFERKRRMLHVCTYVCVLCVFKYNFNMNRLMSASA